MRRCVAVVLSALLGASVLTVPEVAAVAAHAPKKPVVTSVRSSYGATVGYTHVTVHGDRFAGAPTVTFGGTAATHVHVESSHTLVAYAPGHRHGTVQVRVRTKAGTSPKSAHARYKYIHQDPPGTWSASTAPVPSGQPVDDFVDASTSCPTVAVCYTVGIYGPAKYGRYNPPDAEAAAEGGALVSTRTDGDTTTQQIALPPDFAPGNTTIKFVDCPAVGSCVAAGDDNVHGLLLELANGTWTASEADLDQGKNVGQISGLSCAAPGECTATGSSASAGPVLLRLHDGSWTTTGVVPPHSHSGEAGLTGIDCASASYCLAAGYYGYGATHPGAFVVQIADGVQTVRRIPNSPRDGVATNIDAVQCPAVGRCTLIGEFGTRFPHKGSDFVSVRNGSAFVVTPIPLPAGPAPGSTLGSSYGPRATMSCPAVSLCYAAGAYNEHLPAVVRLKGTTVHFYALPRPAGEPNAIVSVDDIDCASRDACTAVGTGDFRSFNSSSEGAYYTFADGVWTTEVSQKAPGQKARPTLTDYTAVDCPAAGACIADGNYAWDLKPDDDDDGELLYMKASGLVSTETPN